MVVTKAKNRRWEELEKNSIELSALVRHFKLYNKTEGKSPKTIDWYNQALGQFYRFLVESEKSTNLGDLGESGVQEALNALDEKYNDPRYYPHYAALRPAKLSETGLEVNQVYLADMVSEYVKGKSIGEQKVSFEELARREGISVNEPYHSRERQKYRRKKRRR